MFIFMHMKKRRGTETWRSGGMGGLCSKLTALVLVVTYVVLLIVLIVLLNNIFFFIPWGSVDDGHSQLHVGQDTTSKGRFSQHLMADVTNCRFRTKIASSKLAQSANFIK